MGGERSRSCRCSRGASREKPGEWYYCLEHKKVEEGPDCPGKDRFGPYASRQEAEHAMESARERNLQWENDPKWHDAPAGGTPDED